MSESYLEDRRKALEEAFYIKKNRELMNKIKEDLNAELHRDELKKVTGIDDDDILQRVLDIGVNVESLAAMSLAPLVLVAWADGNIDGREKKAIIAGAERAGLAADSAALALLLGWLEEEPDETFQEVWTNYIQALCASLTAGDQVRLRETVLGRCQRVAEAAGGFLGLGSISTQEQAMLNQLNLAFDQVV